MNAIQNQISGDMLAVLAEMAFSHVTAHESVFLLQRLLRRPD